MKLKCRFLQENIVRNTKENNILESYKLLTFLKVITEEEEEVGVTTDKCTQLPNLLLHKHNY